MGAAKISAVAGAIALISTAAFAADLAPPLPPPVVPVPVDTSAWYLRGYIGMSNQFFKGMSHPDFATAPGFTFLDKGGFDSAPFFGFGVGYAWTWLRFDVTGEFRGNAAFHARDRYTNSGSFFTNQYSATKSEWVGLFNAYLDLGTWWCITPFVGAGIGFDSITISHFRDDNLIAAGGGWASSGTKTNFAWALHAGASYRVAPNFAVELSYRYLNLGTGRTGTLVNLDPTVFSGNPLAPMTFNHIQSHDLMLGVRWLLQPEQPAYAPPLIRRG
jgi:opacity protein-like surface antigen